jgi:hypothetical protein
MLRSLLLLLIFSGFTLYTYAQSDLFGPSENRNVRHGVVLNINGGYDMPAGDMANRFDNSWRIGPAVMYKSKKNWLIGARFDFITGRNVNEDSLMVNITDKYETGKRNLYSFINNSGQRIGVPVYQRGYATGITAGKIFSRSKDHPDNGLMLLTTVGFMQHRINIYDKDRTVEQLNDGLRKGYDRLTNGMYVGQYVGYVYFAQNKLINFSLGLDCMVGFTRGRRDYLYDVMRADNADRLDILIGIRGGWYLPIFSRKSEDLVFE